MNFFKNFSSYKGQIVEYYCRTLADICKYTGIHNYEFNKSGIVYKPQKSLVDFFIKVLGKLSKLGFSNRALAKKMNSYCISNLLYSEIKPWNADDISLILAAQENGSKKFLPLNYHQLKKGEKRWKNAAPFLINLI